MRIEPRRRRGLARIGALLAAASALAIALTAPANAATTRAVSATKASGTASPTAIPNPVVSFSNVNSGLCLAYDPESRGAARQEACDNDNTVFWQLDSNGAGAYEIIDQNRMQCLSIAGGSSADGATVFVYNCANTADQLFMLVPEFSSFPGAYELVNVNSHKCVAVGGARTNLGAWVIQWTCFLSPEFMWRPF